MTIASGIAEPFGGRLPSENERFAATQLRKILASKMDDGTLSLPFFDKQSGKQEIILTPALAQLLFEVLRHVSKGEAVTLVPVGEMLTTQQAADILNISRPYLIKILDQKKIAFSKIGRHRRIRATDLFAYKVERDLERSDALSELFEDSAELV
ncbi:MAG: helix-turn-helix domain-containing protein [Rhodobacteraceae bacterium]|nr:helix-turn-helix domain-containing protein [Paracoccaceae bacterium]